MPWPWNFGRGDYHTYYHEHPPVTPLDRQEQTFVNMHSNLYRDRSGDVIPSSISAQLMQNGVAPPWNTANVRENPVLNVPFSAAGTCGTPTGMRHYIPNSGQNYVPINTAAALWHTSQFPPLLPSIQLPRQPIYWHNVADHDVHRPVTMDRSYALSQLTNEHARRHYQYVPLRSPKSLAKTLGIYDDGRLHYLSIDGKRTLQMITYDTNVMPLTISKQKLR